MMPPTNAPSGPPIAPPITAPAAIVGAFVVAETLTIFDGPAGQLLFGAIVQYEFLKPNSEHLRRVNPEKAKEGNYILDTQD